MVFFKTSAGGSLLMNSVAPFVRFTRFVGNVKDVLITNQKYLLITKRKGCLEQSPRWLRLFATSSIYLNIDRNAKRGGHGGPPLQVR